MKYLSIFVLFVLFVLGIGLGEAGTIDVSVLRNGDFESWADTYTATYWDSYGTNSLTKTTNYKYEGICSGALRGSTDGSNYVQTKTIYGIQEYQTISYSVYLYEYELDCNILMKFIFYDNENNYISNTSVYLDTNVSGQWVKKTGDVTTPDNTARMKIYLCNTGNTTSKLTFIDNFEIWANDSPILSNVETFENSIAVGNFSYTPETYINEIKYSYTDINWDAYTDEGVAIAMVNGENVSESEENNKIKISYALTSGTTYNFTISKTIPNIPVISYPTNGASIQIENPYNVVNISWENSSCGTEYNLKFNRGETLDDPWYNISTTDTNYVVYLYPGEYCLSLKVYDENINSWSSEIFYSFSIEDEVPIPAYIGIWVKNEQSLLNLTSYNVEISNNTYTTTKSTSSGYVFFNVYSGEYIAKITSSGYAPRTIVIDAPDNVTAYLPANTSTQLITFNLIDYTNNFKFLETRLRVTIPTENGGLVISDNYFDASGSNNIYMLKDIKYSLELVSSGYTKGMGTFTPVKDETISLVAGNIEILPESDDYGGFNYKLTKTNESVSITWIAPINSLTKEFSYKIYDTNDTIVYSLSSFSPTGTATYYYPDPTAQYKISIVAETSEGILRHTEFVSGKTNLIDLQLPDEISDLWYNMISIFILLIIGLTFGAKNASVGAFILAIFTAGLYAIGMLRIDVIIIALILIIGVAAILRGKI